MKRILQISLALVFFVSLAAIAIFTWNHPPGARGKSPALPITDEISPEDQLAQDLALTDPQVITLTTGRRSEVFSVIPTGAQLTEAADSCRSSDCRQVNIYNFEENETIGVIVDLSARRVLDVIPMPGTLPAGNARLLDVAVDVIMNAPEVAAELGRAPSREEIHPMQSSLAGTDCGSIHPCLGATFPVGDRLFWAHVDLTTETFAGIGWSPAPDDPGGSTHFTPDGECPVPGGVDRDGWSLEYEVTPTDGFRISDVSYMGVPFLTSVKLAEWHVDYGATGFVDGTGCGGPGFVILPYGDPYVVDILDENQNVVGFDLVTDFRMSQWGEDCNYRYEQHFQFFNDGRFRVVSAAFGRGCGTNAFYRPLIRIDVAAGGDPDDGFAVWTGNGWDDQEGEFWTSQTGTVTPEGYAWRVEDAVDGHGFYIEPGQGQFNDGGLGDDAFVYVVQHDPAEGDADLNAVGSCCNNDHQQGPENYINGESIDGENLVIWYVPQFETIVEGNDPEYYCWTVIGEPNPETYPCFGGPMFHPYGFTYPPATETPTPSATPSPTATQPGPTESPMPTMTATPPVLDMDIYLPLLSNE